MSRGADIVKATADISLLKDDIMAVVEAKEYANKTMNLINNNFNATVGINSCILAECNICDFSNSNSCFTQWNYYWFIT